MLKTIKGKVIAGTVSVVLLSSAGVAFANSNAGDKLGNWYNVEFGKAAGDVAFETGSYGTEKTTQFVRDYYGLRNGSTTSINGTKTTSTNTSTENINTAKNEHVQAINSKNLELLAGIEAQFNKISDDANTAINIAGAQGLTLATNDLTKHTGKVGSDALKSVTKDLGKASTDAKAELQAAINQAKADLGAKLTSEKNLTTSEIKGFMDTKVTEIKNLITSKQQELVAAQQELITAKASELEETAKAELQSMVDGI